jgi:hypothetical protein
MVASDADWTTLPNDGVNSDQDALNRTVTFASAMTAEEDL